MHKVKNKNVIRRLANKSFSNSWTRNRIAVLAIALTTLLFTTLFTIGLGTIESFQYATMRQSGGDSHGVFKNLTREQYDKLKEHPSIRESAPCMTVADTVTNPEFLKRHVETWYYPTYHYKHCFLEIVDGEIPKKADEILLDEVSMELLGLEAKAGQKVTLEMRLRQSSEKTIRRTFLVSGVLDADPALNVGFAIVSDAYLDKYADELTYTYDEDYSLTGAIRMDVNFANSLGIQKRLDKVITDCGYSTDENQENYIASNANWAYISDGAEGDPLTLAALVAGALLIFLTGYLIIYNVFQISVMKDIRYYGLLKTVGTTGRQVKMILRRQALILSAMGIPLGILAGFFIGKWIVPYILASSFYQSEAQVSFHPLILIGSTLFSVLTVFTSIGKPSRMAAKVSPVEAVRYTDNAQPGKKQAKQKKSIHGGRIPRMALANLARNKGRTAVVIASLSLAVILLNSVFTITNSFDMDKYLKK
ncbi:MAG: ABC transporter permease, partial [Lachnospiraceae bacterium]|nr:ABC transporter permease [Lachnospiraceae bacterium]